jgi:hypothetical protein
MGRIFRLRRLNLAATLGLLAASGCPAAIERNLDALLTPGAESSGLLLAGGVVWPIVEFLLRTAALA